MLLTCANLKCGRLFEYTEGPAHYARSTAHYCSRACQATTHGQTGSARYRLWRSAKQRARELDVPFDIELTDIPPLPVHCPVLGVKLSPSGTDETRDTSPSLDRIVPGRGYVPGNIRVISTRANRLRSDGTADELELIATDSRLLLDAVA